MSGKQKLYDTFTNLIQKYSYSEITIKDFIKEAKVNRNTFYYHFMDMDSFLKSYLDDAICFNMRSKIVENKLSEAYNLLIDYVKEHKKIFINIMQSDKGYDVVDYSFHTSIRMDIQKLLYDYEPLLKIHLPDEFMVFYAHSIADEYMRARERQIYDNTNPEMMKKVFVLYADQISSRLVRVSKLNL